MQENAALCISPGGPIGPGGPGGPGCPTEPAVGDPGGPRAPGIPGVPGSPGQRRVRKLLSLSARCTVGFNICVCWEPVGKNLVCNFHICYIQK